MKLYASLFVACVAFGLAGCCHGNKNQCCQSYSYPAASSCSSCNAGHGHVISSGPISAPTPVPMGDYEVAPMPPAELPQ